MRQQSKFRKQAGYAYGKILFRLKICLHYTYSLKINQICHQNRHRSTPPITQTIDKLGRLFGTREHTKCTVVMPFVWPHFKRFRTKKKLSE